MFKGYQNRSDEGAATPQKEESARGSVDGKIKCKSELTRRGHIEGTIVIHRKML